ncbi:hypothetical protein HPP92_021419 [Vanilla planifolia]|uniref:Uncharacterized protein n=1 Tax=Vanilla planifolia TaxID=51239 RepID=A0A835Q1I6_VANPL|nr:hypothetical protein HPP92_021419 [Vanilla planifolia]
MRAQLTVPARGKSRVTKKVIEYYYEPEMEWMTAISAGQLIFAQFWAIARGWDSEVHVLEAKYKDPFVLSAALLFLLALFAFQLIVRFLALQSLFGGDMSE